uniref:Uncharacterized protein n=1 Tax=Anguilla anguilla TaxID=7936 RepID=A0A0E9XBK1_ANGAN
MSLRLRGWRTLFWSIISSRRRDRCLAVPSACTSRFQHSSVTWCAVLGSRGSTLHPRSKSMELESISVAVCLQRGSWQSTWKTRSTCTFFRRRC